MTRPELVDYLTNLRIVHCPHCLEAGALVLTLNEKEDDLGAFCTRCYCTTDEDELFQYDEGGEDD